MLYEVHFELEFAGLTDIERDKLIEELKELVKQQMAKHPTKIIEATIVPTLGRVIDMDYRLW